MLLYSIIIPTLNEEYFVPNLLSDLEKQTEKDFEVIVVDGHSEDQTSEAALKFAQKLPLQFFQAEMRKTSHQRNYGAKKARGKYLIFLDADSRIDPLFLEQFTQALLLKKERVFLPYLLPDRNHIHIAIVFKIANVIIKASRLFRKPFASGGSFFIEKRLFHKMNGFDESLYLGEDHDLVRRIHKMGIISKILNDAKIVVSLRRMDLEGQLVLLLKYIRVAFFIFLNGKITEKIFDYEMGGQGYWHRMNGLTFTSYLYRKNLVLMGALSILLLTFLALFAAYSSLPNHTDFNKKVLASKISDYKDTVFASSAYKKYEKILVTKVIQPIKTSVPIRDLTFPRKEVNNLTTGFIAA